MRLWYRAKDAHAGAQRKKILMTGEYGRRLPARCLKRVAVKGGPKECVRGDMCAGETTQGHQRRVGAKGGLPRKKIAITKSAGANRESQSQKKTRVKVHLEGPW